MPAKLLKHSLFLALFLVQTPLLAKNLDGRFGLGMNYLAFTNSPAISFKYFHDQLLATSFLAGFSTEGGAYVLGIKSLRNVILEENMNVYLGIAGFVLSNQDSGGASSTGLEFDALFGAEFFFSGLPNLAFAFEAGLGLRALRVTSFRTVGGGFASGAIHYYF